jgi:hypothetical protein
VIEILISSGGYVGDVYQLRGVYVSDISLPAYGYVLVPVSIQTTGDVVNYLTAHPIGYSVTMDYTYSVSGMWLFWTITKEATGGMMYQQLGSQPYSRHSS